MKKKVLCLVSVLLVISLTACGNKQNVSEMATQETQIEQEATELNLETETVEEDVPTQQEETSQPKIAISESQINSQEQSEVTTEFELGENLKAAISELTLMCVNFDSSHVKEEGYAQHFISHFLQNSRFSFDYLHELAEKQEGILSVEDVEYIHRSLTNQRLDFGNEVSEEGIDVFKNASGWEFGNIISYEAETDGDEVHLVATFERGTKEFLPVKIYELNVILLKNPESCFDGYSILSLTSEDITPIKKGDNKEHTFRGTDMEFDNNGVFTFEYIVGDDDIEYDMFMSVDLSEKEELADFVRTNAGEEFEVTYFLDETMTQPVYEVVPIRIRLYVDEVVCAPKFSKKDFYLLSSADEFYELLLGNPIIQQYEPNNAESTGESVEKSFEQCDVWNRQIEFTGTGLKGLLGDGESDKMQNIMDLWKDYYEEKVSLFHVLYGMTGLIPGSMYTEIAADNIVNDNTLMAYALLSLEYELSENVKFVTENEEDGIIVPDIYWYDFDAENVCPEWSQDFQEILDSYSLDGKNSEELEAVITETANRIQETMGSEGDLVANVNKYLSIINSLNELEEGVSTDDRYIKVKEERLRLYATQLLNIEYMLEEC